MRRHEVMGAVVLAGLGVVLGLGGCGSANRYQTAPASAVPEESAPTTIEEAQAQLDRSEVRLRQFNEQQPLVGAAPPSLSGGMTSPPPPPPPGPTMTPGPATAGSPPSPQAPDVTHSNSDGSRDRKAAESCRDVCRALSSMRRAADTICRLTSESDERCQSARGRVQKNEGQSGACHCGG